MNRFFNFLEYKQALIRFNLEAFFELMICVLIGLKILDIRKIWGTPEYVAFAIQLVFTVIFMGFILLSLHFICCKEPKMIKSNKLKSMRKHEETMSQASQ